MAGEGRVTVSLRRSIGSILSECKAILPEVRVYLLVMLGGAIGAAARLGLATILAQASLAFPWATLSINLLGSFLIGILAAAGLSESGRAFFMTGVLGGFTTFSSFSLEVGGLLAQNRLNAALAYAAASLLGGVSAAILGIALGRRIY